MIPVLTPSEMAGVDRAAPDPVPVLVARAGYATFAAARRLMGGTYGKRVVVVAGPGNNGADGRAAARTLQSQGARVVVVEAGENSGDAVPSRGADLVVDAAFGTGLSRPYRPPPTPAAPVLAVDIPSGVSGATGIVIAGGGALHATATVTFAAYKPGLLLGDGPRLAGEVTVARIGLEDLAADAATAWLVTDEDVRRLVPGRDREAHKWQAAVQVVGGSPGMVAAPMLAAIAALRAGAGYAWVGVPGAPPGGGLPPGEYVGHGLPAADWGERAAHGAERTRAVVIGPGLGHLGRGPHGQTGAGSPVARLLASTAVPAVVDADGIGALGSLEAVREVTSARKAPVVVTPHAGEYTRLVGSPPGEDRIASVREAARVSGAVVLLKGPTTIVADPYGRVLIASAGSPRLATAGTGDVLSGVIGAFIARGVPAFEAAALGAHCHGRAASLGQSEGLVASDLPSLVSTWLSGVLHQ